MKTTSKSVLPSVDHSDRFTSALREALSILIVDDEDSMRTYVDRVLREAGYRTTLAADGFDAIKVAATTDRFDLLLTDVHMPDLSGPQLVRELRTGDPLLKVLYLTGYCEQLFTEKTTYWEDEAFLEKPCSAADLLQAVSLALGASGAAARSGNLQ